MLGEAWQLSEKKRRLDVGEEGGKRRAVAFLKRDAPRPPGDSGQAVERSGVAGDWPGGRVARAAWSASAQPTPAGMQRARALPARRDELAAAGWLSRPGGNAGIPIER